MSTTRRGLQFAAVIVAIMVAAAFVPLLSDAMQSHAAAKLKVSQTEVAVNVGSSVDVSAQGLSAKKLKKVTWSSSDTTVANLTKAKGKATAIQGIKDGTATITAKYGKKKAKIAVTVQSADPNANTTVNPNGYVKPGDVSITGYYQGDATVYSLLYQESAEVAAQQMQAFRLAKDRAEEAIAANGGSGEGLAIITDIDSTIMDDTCYIAGAVLDASARISLGLEPWNNDDWKGYYGAVATTADGVIPGAKEFVDFTYEKGIEWYYITNRPYYELDLTVKQLDNAGFFEKYAKRSDLLSKYKAVEAFQDYIDYGDPKLEDYANKINATGSLEIQAGSFSVKDDYRVQVQGTDFDSDKTDRRVNARAAAGGADKVIMYLGDSINDMVSDAEADVWGSHAKDFTRKQFNDKRTSNASDPYWKDHWGQDFIVLPNATYGDWYKATWAKDSSVGADPKKQQEAIYDQIWDHSYKNTKKFSTWYKGKSPIGPEIQ